MTEVTGEVTGGVVLVVVVLVVGRELALRGAALPARASRAPGPQTEGVEWSDDDGTSRKAGSGPESDKGPSDN